MTATTVVQPWPKATAPTVTPAAPKSCGTAMVRMRMRYASAVSPMTPDRAPMEASAPYSGRPTASPIASGRDIATAARTTAARETGSCCGRRFLASQSGGVSTLGNWRGMSPL